MNFVRNLLISRESTIMHFQSSVVVALALLFMGPMGVFTRPVPGNPNTGTSGSDSTPANPPPSTAPQSLTDNVEENAGRIIGNIWGTVTPSNLEHASVAAADGDGA